MIERDLLNALARVLSPFGASAIDITGTVSSGTTTSITSSNVTNVESNRARHCILKFTSGTNNNYQRIIYTSTGSTVTWGWPLDVAPVNGDTFTIKSAPLSDAVMCWPDQPMFNFPVGILLIPRGGSLRTAAMGRQGVWATHYVNMDVEILAELDQDFLHSPTTQMAEYRQLYDFATQIASVIKCNRALVSEGSSKNTLLVGLQGDLVANFEYLEYQRERQQKVACSFRLMLTHMF